MALNQFDSLKNQIKETKTSLSASPTAYSGSASPTFDDTAKQGRLISLKKKLELAQAEKAKTDWFGSEEDKVVTAEKPKMGLINKTVNMFNQPTYMAVGALKSLTGKSDDGFFETMRQNMQEDKEAFGDLLMDLGVNHYIAGPVGFLLDVGFAGATDPIALAGIFGKGTATAKYGSSFWRAAEGAKAGFQKEGLEGAGKAVTAALKSSVLEKGAKATSMVPVLNKSKYAEPVYEASKKALGGYEKAVGKDFLGGLDSISHSNPLGMGMSKLAEDTVRKHVPKGNFIWDTFVGEGTEGWYIRAKKKQAVENLGVIKNGKVAENWKDIVDESAGKYAQKTDIDHMARPRNLEPKFADPESLSTSINYLDDVQPELKPAVGRARNAIDESVEILHAPKNVAEAQSSKKIIENLIEEHAEEVSLADVYKYVNEYKSGNKTGIEAFDKLYTKMASKTLGENKLIGKYVPPKFKDVKYVKNTLDTYEKFMGLFKTSKIGGSMSARVNSYIGNPMMAGMEGRNITDPNYFKRVRHAKLIFQGKSSTEVLNALTSNKSVLEFVEKNPDVFRKIFGFDFKHLEDILQTTNSRGGAKFVERNSDVFRKVFGDDFKDLDAESMLKSVESNPNLLKALESTKDKEGFIRDLKSITNVMGRKVYGDRMEAAIKKIVSSDNLKPGELDNGFVTFVTEFYKKNGVVPTMDNTPINFASNFIDSGAMAKWKIDLAAKAEKGNKMAKYMHWYLTKPMENYELSDSAYRLGQFMQDTMDGVSAGELEKMSRFYKIRSTDFQLLNPKTGEAVDELTKGAERFYWKNGQKTYKLTADKAAELAAGTYMNYAAMPAAVRVMRNLPVVGSPFASFGYSMLGKTAKTMVYNPAYFSKASLGLHEASNFLAGQQSPMEKASLEDRQAYLNNPWMLRLKGFPFFKDHPVYLNLNNASPFLSNILSPNNRIWSDTIKGKIGSFLDRMPLMKDPIGAMLMSYFVLPFLLEDDQAPQNMFGSVLYPQDSTNLEKLGFATRDVAESVLPTMAGALAIPAHYMGPEAMRSPEFINKVPLFSYRNTAFAQKGKSSVGSGSAQSLENPQEKIMQKYASLLGVSLNPVNLTTKKK